METIELPYVWCLVANVTTDPHPEGPGREMRVGTKRFAPGAKLYCWPPMWGDGCERLQVLGRHRGGGPKLIEIIVSTKLLVNYRVQKVYNPHVVRCMTPEWGIQGWGDTDESKARAEQLAAILNHRVAEGRAGTSDPAPV